MASLILKPTGKYMVKFYRDKRPVHMMLPTGNKKQAQTILNMVDRRLVQIKTGEPDRVLDNWVAELSDDMRSRFERCGLLDEKPKTKSFTDVSLEYIAMKEPLWKKLTLNRRTQEHKRLALFFGDTAIDAVVRKTANDFLNWLITDQKLAPMTISKIMKWASAVYAFAIECEYVFKANPFRGVKIPAKILRQKEYISVKYTDKLIEAAPNIGWKTMIALLRYGGLRPSEAILSRWQDIDWETNTFTFRSPKTERHEGKDQRTIPLFPKLKEALEKARAEASPKDEYILSSNGWDSKRQAMAAGRAGTLCEITDFVKKAGLPNPGSLPTNMRGSCSTDLKQAFPEFVVDAWLGHSTAIAHKHYDVVTRKNMELAGEIDVFSEPEK